MVDTQLAASNTNIERMPNRCAYIYILYMLSRTHARTKWQRTSRTTLTMNTIVLCVLVLDITQIVHRRTPIPYDLMLSAKKKNYSRNTPTKIRCSNTLADVFIQTLSHLWQYSIDVEHVDCVAISCFVRFESIEYHFRIRWFNCFHIYIYEDEEFNPNIFVFLFVADDFRVTYFSCCRGHIQCRSAIPLTAVYLKTIRLDLWVWRSNW